MMQLRGNIILQGKIETLTGLHVGGSSEALQIGGIDGWVIRDAGKDLPYIPGSSIKGKMRMLCEYANGRVTDGKVCEDPNTEVCQIFGASGDKSPHGPSRIIVRDAYPDKETIKMWGKIKSDLRYTEVKGENTIDRITSQANPRFFERVVAGSKFDFQMVYSIYNFQGINDLDNFKHVYQSLTLLEHSTLGGHGSRGYGRIKFELEEMQFFTVADYKDGKAMLKEGRPTYSLNDYKVEEQLEAIQKRLS